MADILTQSWQETQSVAPIGIARAGNVIGGGDNSKNRLIPNLMESITKGETPSLRNPDAVRPWQNVLDCLNGYLMAIDKLIEYDKSDIWNFGPNENQSKTVADVANIAGVLWGVEKAWENDLESHPREASRLMLNSNKAREKLGWSDKLSFKESIEWTIDWYKNVNNGNDPFEETLKNIKEFEARA
jgi:CDP-glucose 4,6-dehydratase